ncbi:MAG TPA: TrkA C-terminal domain-containing protein [Bacillota bacterium]|nr:TrkA C-terminal domain-containing protein [Bacillota bacterium]
MDLEVISTGTQAALILAAVISCILSPILFHRFAPMGEMEEVKKVSLFGTNPISFALAQDLSSSGYDVKIYKSDDRYPLGPEVDPLDKQSTHLLQSDYLLCLSNDEQRNMEIANWGKENHIPTVICRLINDENGKHLKEGIHIFSPYRSGKILLRALIDFPSLIKFLEADQPLKEIVVRNKDFNQYPVKNLSIGDALIIRIFRENDMIIPHGDTRIQVGDTLLISGEMELLREIKQMLSYEQSRRIRQSLD